MPCVFLDSNARRVTNASESRAAFISPQHRKMHLPYNGRFSPPPFLSLFLCYFLLLVAPKRQTRRVDSPLRRCSPARVCAHVRIPGCIRRVSAAVDSLRQRYSLFRPSRPNERCKSNARRNVYSADGTYANTELARFSVPSVLRRWEISSAPPWRTRRRRYQGCARTTRTLNYRSSSRGAGRPVAHRNRRI